jgi:hypothetical protein
VTLSIRRPLLRARTSGFVAKSRQSIFAIRRNAVLGETFRITDFRTGVAFVNVDCRRWLSAAVRNIGHQLVSHQAWCNSGVIKVKHNFLLTPNTA